ncbi:MAG TPA: hypothetical protein VNL94_06625, partial [Candidatus Binatia bacterium]|nr:hypothetical protein [Candidatus Binatia bacterium]
MTEQPMGDPPVDALSLDASSFEPLPEPAPESDGGAARDGARSNADIKASAGASAAQSTADAAQPAAPPEPDGADASLLALIDRLSGLLDRSELTELEVQVGGTGLVLRKPSAIAPQVVVAGQA